MADSNIPPDYLCPISYEIMKDPVICADGNSYERCEIENWFKKNNTSPLTGLKLRNTHLIPNNTLKRAIIQYQEQKVVPSTILTPTSTAVSSVPSAPSAPSTTSAPSAPSTTSAPLALAIIPEPQFPEPPVGSESYLFYLSFKLQFNSFDEGKRIRVRRDSDNYEGVVQSFDPSSCLHTIRYDDGCIRVFNMNHQYYEIFDDSGMWMDHLEWRNTLQVGSLIDCLDDSLDINKHWFAARIIDVGSDYNKILVHFEGWSERWNQWINRFNKKKIAPIHTYTMNWREFLEVGDTIEVKLRSCTDNDKWYLGTVLEIMGNRGEERLVRVGVTTNDDNYNEICISINSCFLTKLGTHIKREKYLKTIWELNRGTYFGEVVNKNFMNIQDQPQGYGNWYYTDIYSCILYTGNFRDGNFYGYGVLITGTRGYSHERLPQWKDKVSVSDLLYQKLGFEKFGISCTSVKTTYKGHFTNGNFNGHGVLKNFEKNSSYTGKFKNNKKHGYGELITSYGTYNGEWQDDQLQGECTFKSGDGPTYECTFHNGLPYNGYSWLEYGTGNLSHYQGYFENGLRQGYGVITYKNGNVYKGNWENDKIHGRGEFKLKNGHNYIGNWNITDNEGYGKYIYDNGDFYEGVQDGQGMMIYADGKTCKFFNGKPYTTSRKIFRKIIKKIDIK